MTAATDPRRDRLSLVVHIGSGKTGTSSIQQLLNRNRRRLAESGLLYPRTPGARRHLRLGLSLRDDADLERQVSWPKQGAASAEEFRARVRRELLEEIAASGLSRVLLSDEALYGAPVPALRRLRELLAELTDSARVVVYLRRQDDHLCSRYQEVVKIGETRRLVDRTAQMDFSATYDYWSRLNTWRRVVEPAELTVRRFEREAFVGGSLFDDFFATVGIDLRPADLRQVSPQNESLDAESVEFLRILNLYRVEQEGATPGMIHNRPLIGRLARLSTGPTLTLPPAVLDDFMARWEESNAAVAREFLGDPSGRLFQAPRRDRDSTTEQRLDPARVDDLAGRLDLSEALREPLRRIAEREAATPPA